MSGPRLADGTEAALAAERGCKVCGIERSDQTWEHDGKMHVDARPFHYWVLLLKGSGGWEARLGGPDRVTVFCPEHTMKAAVEKARAIQQAERQREASP